MVSDWREWNALFCGVFLNSSTSLTIKGLGFDKTVITQAKKASTRQVKNADSLRRSVADNFMIAIFEVKGKRQKVKGSKSPFTF
jgi:hypothetical protein